MPRSLKDPVGLSPSTLIHTSAPVSSESHGLSTSGVPPSRRVYVGVPSGSGNHERYSSMTPRHWRGRRAGGLGDEGATGPPPPPPPPPYPRHRAGPQPAPPGPHGRRGGPPGRAGG